MIKRKKEKRENQSISGVAVEAEEKKEKGKEKDQHTRRPRLLTSVQQGRERGGKKKKRRGRRRSARSMPPTSTSEEEKGSLLSYHLERAPIAKKGKGGEGKMVIDEIGYLTLNPEKKRRFDEEGKEKNNRPISICHRKKKKEKEKEKRKKTRGYELFQKSPSSISRSLPGTSCLTKRIEKEERKKSTRPLLPSSTIHPSSRRRLMKQEKKGKEKGEKKKNETTTPSTLFPLQCQGDGKEERKREGKKRKGR